MRTMIASALVFAATVFPVSAQGVQQYDIRLSPQAATSIINLLAGSGPWNVVDPLIRDLQNQIAVQNQAAQEAAMKAIRDQAKAEAEAKAKADAAAAQKKEDGAPAQ